MTLFTDDRPGTVDDLPVERYGRFVLNRAGIRNVWQYDDTVLRFAGGRLLLRGKNGAGKSKAMEMLLPFLLDGDTRSIDSVAKDRTTLHWLMTDGRDDANPIGYMWLELRCATDDGDEEEFRTLGCGVKTSPSTRKPVVWFFCTPKRVAVDLVVEDAAGMLAQDAFRAQLEADEYFTTSAAYAAKVARDIYGIEDIGRYRNLCHLLYQLRRPSVGENIEAGEHTKVLSEALPPLDDDLVASVARSFDDLAQIHDDLGRLESTERAVAEFLGSYRNYTRTILRGRSAAVSAAADAAETARRDLSRAEETADTAATERDDTQGRVDDLEADESNARAELDVLHKLPAYSHAQAIDDRRERVAAYKKAARSAEESAESARSHEEQAAKRVGDTAADVEDGVRGSETARQRLQPLLTAAGLDQALAGSALVVSVADEAQSEERRSRVDGGGAIIRVTPRRVDPSSIEEAVSAQRTLVESLQSTANLQMRTVTVLAEEARQVDKLAEAAVRLEQEAGAAEEGVSAAETAETQARDAAAVTEGEWRQAVRAWAAGDICRQVGGAWAGLAAFVADPDPGADLLGAGDLDDAQAAVDEVFGPAQQQANLDHAEALSKERDAGKALEALRGEREALAAADERLPVPSAYRSAERDPETGAPFYAVVAFAEGHDPVEAAMVEAALEAAGLLDGWISGDGTLSAAGHDVTLHPAVLPPGAASLSQMLTVALPPDCPVASDVIEKVLAGIGLGEHADATTWVDTNGRYRLGVSRGSWEKETVEYVGVGARLAARERALAALDQRISEAESELAAAGHEATARAAWSRQLHRARNEWPSPADLLQALGVYSGARAATQSAQRRHIAAAEKAANARQNAITAQRELQTQAGRQGLPHTTGQLDALAAALKELQHGLRQSRESLDALARAGRKHGLEIDAWQAAVANREAVETRAAREQVTYETEAQQLASLEDNFGAEAAEVMAQIAAYSEQLDAATENLPEARRVASTAQTAYALAEQAVTTTRNTLADREADCLHQVETLGRILATPGLALAAFGPTGTSFSMPAGTDGTAHMRALKGYAGAIAAAAAGGPDVSNTAILGRYEALGPGLAGGYDASAAETDEGVKVFELHDDSGTRPIAVVAERLANEVSEAKRRLTARQEEVFQRFLLGELGDHLRRQLLDADTLVRAMNDALAGVRTSHGLGVKLAWHLKEDAAAEAAEAIPLLRDAPGIRGSEKTARLGELLGGLIEAARIADPTASYEAHLRNALDYRHWHTFTIKVLEAANPGRERRLTKKLKVSQGEQRVLAYLALFSGASAYFDSLRRSAPHALRVILLDDAFAKVDEPTHARLLQLLKQLDLDFILTSERVTGCVPGLSLEIYECLRDPHLRGVATVHTHWDGQRAQLLLV